MFCIFCKSDSSNSKSVEHIIPESLGNNSHILTSGVVCDRCNNYFATKIENEVLNSHYFRNLRGRNFILNKKGKTSKIVAFITTSKINKIEIDLKKNAIEAITNSEIFELIKNGQIKELHIPISTAPKPNDVFLSRFLGKVAFEALVERILKIGNWNVEIVTNPQFDILRNYVRYFKGVKYWPYHQRRIYEETSLFIDKSDDTKKPNPYQLLHEYDFLFIDKVHLYFIVCIMGIEYAINVAQPTVSHYLNWLKTNNYKSPLERPNELKL